MKKAADFVRLVGLQDFADLTPAELSTGMKQRLGLARVLASQAQLLLMDEPFASLDFLTRGELQSQLLAIQKKAPAHHRPCHAPARRGAAARPEDRRHAPGQHHPRI